MMSEEILWEYADGALDEIQRKAVAQALAGDAMLAARYKDIMATHKLLQMQCAEIPSPVFMASVMRAIEAAPAFAAARNISVLPVVVFAMALLLLMLAACIVLSAKGVLHPITFQISPGTRSNLRFYSILADVVLLLLFIESWYSRFKNTMA